VEYGRPVDPVTRDDRYQNRPKGWRRWRRVVAIAAAVLVVLAGGAAAGIWAYGRSLNHDLKRTDAFAGLPSDRPSQNVTGALNILLLGSDSRNPDNTSSSRTDTIMLMHVDADHKHAYTISIPRDTWVYVPASPDGRNGDTMAKINAAYAWGGTPLVVQTVENFTGVGVDHVVMIDFSGFRQVVDALSGVDMQVEKTITSIHPPYRTFTKGDHHFDGAEALDYVRQRYQYADGDFTRERHQQEFLLALMDKAASTGTLANPVRLNAFLRAVTKSVTVDQDFDLVSTAFALRGLGSDDVTFLSNPSAGTQTIDGQSVVKSNTAKAKALYEAVTTDTVGRWVAANQAKTAAPTPSVAP
jgi:LCP family protein required for cell wall assembly